MVRVNAFNALICGHESKIRHTVTPNMAEVLVFDAPVIEAMIDHPLTAFTISGKRVIVGGKDGGLSFQAKNLDPDTVLSWIHSNQVEMQL